MRDTMMDFQGIYLVTGATDFRKGIDGYAGVIKSQLHREPTDHALYIFCNRNRTKIKCLYYDGPGFWLLYKRLNEGHFKWKLNETSGVVEISEQQLRWLLEGLKIDQKTAFKKVDKSFC